MPSYTTSQYKLIRQHVAPYFISGNAFSHLLSTKSSIPSNFVGVLPEGGPFGQKQFVNGAPMYTINNH
jgi:hypothetical protein